MKHQETLRSSSSRRSTPTRTTKDHHHHHQSSHHANVGCMAGILQLVQSKYHTRRKFLTFGKKQSKHGQEEVSVTAALPSPPPPGKTPPPSSPPPSQPFKSSKKQKPAAHTITITPPSPTPPTENREAVKSVRLIGKLDNQSRELRRASPGEAVIRPRSPTIPAEIRRSQSNSRLNFAEENQISTSEQNLNINYNNGNQSQIINDNQIRAPPALVARLMGLDESSPRVSTSTSTSSSSSSSSSPSTTPPPDNINLQSSSAAEKRRKLLGALERCDEDLKELRKVIEAHVRSEPPINQSEKSSSSAAVVVETDDDEKYKLVGNVVAADNSNNKFMTCRRKRDETNYKVEEMAGKIIGGNCEFNCGEIRKNNQDQEQSPVSVLDQDRFQSSPPSSGCCNKKIGIGKGLEEQPVVLQQHYDDQHQVIKRKLREEYCITNNRRHFLVNKSSIDDDDHKYFQDRIPVFPPWTSKALTDTVNEVCQDIAWGQRRELGIIGLLVQDGIFKDLVDDIVSDLGGNYHGYGRLQSYKRKLCF